MREIIYADIVILLNFCIDFLGLFAAGKILGLKLRASRIILSAVFGAVYSLCVIFFNKIIIPEIILNIGVSIIMCFIAFRIESAVKFLKIFAIFYAACFMLGGGIEALYQLSGLSEKNSAPSFQIIIILAAVCVIIIIFAGRLFKRRAIINELEIIIGYEGRETKISAILDSGNLLRDPVSSLPVIIINLNAAANLFDLKTLEFFAGDSPAYISEASKDAEKIKILRNLKFKIIPVKSVGGANILPAFTPEYIKYKNKKNMTQINAVVAVDSSGNINGGIIPAELID